MHRQDWVVYAKPAFGGPTQVLKYLGRYTHRVAISNHRLLAFLCAEAFPMKASDFSIMWLVLAGELAVDAVHSLCREIPGIEAANLAAPRR